MRRVDDCHVEPGVDGVLEEHRVERAAGVRRDAEAQVGDAEHREAAGHMRFDRANAVDRLDAGAPQLFLAGCEREGDYVEDQRLVRDAVLLVGDLGDAAGDLKLALGGMRHAFFVDRHRDRGRAVARDQRHGAVDFVAAAAFERERVDDSTARVDFERRLQDVGLGGVDDQRQLDVHRQLLDQLDHLLFFVGALGHRHADVEDMCPRVYLLARHLEQAIVVVVQQQALDFARAERVDALADHRGRRFLAQRGRAYA